jgi:F0F1-type ATP synthase delta subunit
MELEIPHLDNPAERRKLVRAIGIFRKLRKISRTRAEKLFARSQNGFKDALIITGQPIEKDEEKYLISIFKKIFPDAHTPNFTLHSHLLGGVRMVYGDEMVELSLNQLDIKK